MKYLKEFIIGSSFPVVALFYYGSYYVDAIEELNRFIYKPKEYIPGTKMNFAGIKKAEDRANLILWLRELSDNPFPLP